jgi:hypothetical protein
LLRLFARSAFVAALTLSPTACGEDTVTPTPTPTTTTLSFSSTMVPGGTASRSFTAERAGKVTVQYGSFSPQSDVTLRLSFGTFDGTNCTPTTTLDTLPGTTAQISTDITAGNYCVKVADVGGVVQVSVFSVIIVLTINP